MLTETQISEESSWLQWIISFCMSQGKLVQTGAGKNGFRNKCRISLRAAFGILFMVTGQSLSQSTQFQSAFQGHTARTSNITEPETVRNSQTCSADMATFVALRNEVQTVQARHVQMNLYYGSYFHEYKRGLVWSFDLHDPCDPGSADVFKYTWRTEKPSFTREGEIKTNFDWPENMPTLSKMKCDEENQVISKLYLKQDFNEAIGMIWTPRATKNCSKLPHGFFFVNDTTFTFDASEFNQDRGILPWQIPCAHKHAVLVEVEFKREAMISTCKFVSKTCDWFDLHMGRSTHGLGTCFVWRTGGLWPLWIAVVKTGAAWPTLSRERESCIQLWQSQ